jgi:hypothetical protein
VVPNSIPGVAGRAVLGHDFEVLNVPLGSGVSARNHPAGHVMDPEIRFYLGAFRREYFTASRKGWMPVLTVAFGWGHSTYFHDL